MSEVRRATTCPYCGVGCGIIATCHDGAARRISIAGDPQHPANQGRLCIKGSHLAETVGLEGRLLHPMVGGLRTSWEHALDQVATILASTIATYGRDAVALYVSGQLLTEDYYVANKLVKGLLGCAQIDTNSRLCMSSAVAAHKRAFGEDVVPQNYDDIEAADMIVLVGANAAWCHPILYQRIKAAKERRPELYVVVIDPRRTATCEIADLHLPLRPGSDISLWNGLLVYLDEHGGIDHDYCARHTQGLEATLQQARDEVGAIADVARICDLDAGHVAAFYQRFIDTPLTLSLFSQGSNQSLQGVDKGNALINCHLASGRLHRRGAGVLSLTGQPNAMGGREVGGLANQLAAHLELEHAEHRQLLAEFWRCAPISAYPGDKAVDLFAAIASGRIRAVWIIGSNPVVSLPEADRVGAALARCPHVIVSDCIADTDTTRHAHILLPALAWGEKDGSVTNSERRISRQRRFLPVPGEARADWWILSEVGRRLGGGSMFDYQNAAQIFREHAALSVYRNAGATRRRFHLAGLAQIDDAAYERMTPQQWPVDAPAHPYADHHVSHADGRARLIPVRQAPDHDRRDAKHPWLLNTGRLRDQWHTMTRTGLSATLLAHTQEPYVDIHPDDAQVLGIKDDDLIALHRQEAHSVLRARLSTQQRRGELFAPIHWTGVLSRSGRIGPLVHARCDPLSGQPDSKMSCVALQIPDIAWQASLVSAAALPLPPLYYATQIRLGQGFRQALAEVAGGMSFADWLHGLTLPTLEMITADDAAANWHRRAWLEQGRLVAFLAAPWPSAADLDWASSLLGQRLDGQQRKRLLALQAGTASSARGRRICSCFGVHEQTLIAAIRAGRLDSVAAIGQATRAGSNCGSCQSELAELLRREQALRTTAVQSGRALHQEPS